MSKKNVNQNTRSLIITFGVGLILIIFGVVISSHPDEGTDYPPNAWAFVIAFAGLFFLLLSLIKIFLLSLLFIFRKLRHLD